MCLLHVLHLLNYSPDRHNKMNESQRGHIGENEKALYLFLNTSVQFILNYPLLLCKRLYKDMTDHFCAQQANPGWLMVKSRREHSGSAIFTNISKAQLWLSLPGNVLACAENS